MATCQRHQWPGSATFTSTAEVQRGSTAAGPCHFSFSGEAGAHSLDMFLMVLCSFMAFSQSLPLNSSMTTLRTVPSSRQCGAIPRGKWHRERRVPDVSETRCFTDSWKNPQQQAPRYCMSGFPHHTLQLTMSASRLTSHRSDGDQAS